MVRYVMGLTAVVVVAAVVVFGFGLGTGNSSDVTYRFVNVDRGRIVNVVSATGKLRPVTTVVIGSQISGQIAKLFADFNTPVKEGQEIARIDPATFEAKVAEGRADLAVARANVVMQQATVLTMEAEIMGARAALAEAEQNLVRRRQLFERRVLAESEIEKAVSARDQARSKLDGAVAKLEMQRAQLVNAKANVNAKEATLKQRELDLDRTIIRSPVDGVVISRNVDIGQTVAASLQAPVLFTIAQDLREMEVEVSVDEADIGRVGEGQTASFTVDAFPAREFVGKVRQIRKAPVEVSNVVTYAVVLTTDNSDQALLPGMTANVSIIAGERENALRLATSALRFRPRSEGPQAAAAPSAAGARLAGSERVENQLKRLTGALDLRPEQREAVRGILSDSAQKMRALRSAAEDRGASPGERGTVEQVRAASRRQIEAVLDESQRTAYRAMQPNRAEGLNRRVRVWVVGPDGLPKGVDIVTGLADATTIEIVSGPLKAGDQVIIAASEPPQPRGFRLGF